MSDSGDRGSNDAPEDRSADRAGSEGSTPWERPGRWEADTGIPDTNSADQHDTTPSDAAPDGNTSDTAATEGTARPRRETRAERRRREAEQGDDDDPDGVSASDLIAALTGQIPVITDATPGPGDGETNDGETNDGETNENEIAPVALIADEDVTPGGQHSGREHRRGWWMAGRSVIAVVAILLLVAAGAEWVIKARADATLTDHTISALHTDDTNIITPTITTPDPDDRTDTGHDMTDAGVVAPTFAAENVLILGSDTRTTNADEELGGSDDGPGGSDVIMIAHIAADRSHMTVVSIPRDTYIQAPTCQAWDHETHRPKDETYTSPYSIWRINSTFAAGGPPCTVTAVQQLTGLRIDRVIVIDFAGFTGIVDALGGITVNACHPIIDRNLGTVLPAAGEQHIDGIQALNLVRARKVVGDSSSDLARIHRQQQVLATVLEHMTSAGVLLNPVKLDNVLQAVVNNVRTDNVTMDDLLDLAQSFGDLDPGQVTFFTLPTYPDDNGIGLHPTDNSALIWQALRRDETVVGSATSAPPSAENTATLSVVTSLTTMTQPPVTSAVTSTVTSTPSQSQTLSVAPGDINLHVVNVAGHSLVATNAANALRGVGFTIGSSDLLRLDGQTQDDITVEYATGHLAEAMTVAAAVPGTRLVVDDSLGDRVRIMLGTSFDATAFQDDVRRVSVGSPLPSRLSTSPEPVTSTLTSTTVSTPDPVTSTLRSTITPPPGDSEQPTTLPSSEVTSVNGGNAGCL